MRQFTFAGIAGLLAVVAAPVQAQDLVSSVNSVTRSYNYVEIQYLPDVDADLPILAIAVIDINDNWSLRGEYTKLDIDLGDDSVDFDAVAYSVGVLYHKPLVAMSNSDWVAGLSLGRIDLEIDYAFLDEPITGSVDFQEGYLGIRRTLTPKLEGEAGVTAYHDEDESDISLEGDLKLVYRVRPSLDIALSLNEIGEGDLFGFGLRYTWN